MDLGPVTERLQRFCVHCGRPFLVYGDYPAQRARRMTCSAKCHVARWRAIGMLEGTLEYVNGTYRRRVE